MIEITQNAIYYQAKKDKTYQKWSYIRLKLSQKIKRIKNFSKYPKISVKKMAESTIEMNKNYSNMAICGALKFSQIYTII